MTLTRDGKDDYIHVDSNGGLSVWYNQGGGDTRMLTESVRFAKFYSDAVSSPGNPRPFEI